MDIISPMYDFMFKRMFSIPDNKFMLCDFLTACIDFKGEELKNVTLIDKEIRKNRFDKDSVMDLRVEVKTAENTFSEVDVEVQIKKYDSFGDRMTYYLAKMFSDQLGEGDSYNSLHKCVTLCVLDFPLFNDKDYFRRMLIRDEKGNILSDKMEFDCLEVSKIKETELTDNMDKKLQWAKLFAASSEEELNMVNENANNPAINQAVLTIKKLSATEEMKYEALAREKAYRDNLTIMEDAVNKGKAVGRAEGRAEGIAEGRAEGRAEVRAAIAARMKEIGMTDSQINAVLYQDDPDSDEDEDVDLEP